MAVHFLDVNCIFKKRIIRTFGKCTSISIAMSAEISLINEAVTAVWSDFGVEADEKGKPRSPDRLKYHVRMQATKSQRRTVIFTARLYFY